MLDIVERGADAAARHFREVGHRTRRLQRAQHIGRRLRIERVGIEEVRTARTCRTWSAAARPDWRPPRPGSSKSGAARVARTRHRRIVRGAARPDPWSAASAASSADGGMPARNRAVSLAVAVSAARAGASEAARNMAGSDRRDFHGLKHLYSRPGDDGRGALIGARLRKTA